MPNLIKRIRKGRTQFILSVALISTLVLGIPCVDINVQSKGANPYITPTVTVSVTSPNQLLIPNGITVPENLVACVAEEVTFKAKGLPSGGNYYWITYGSNVSPPFHWRMPSGSTSGYVTANASGESIITKRFAIPGIYQASITYYSPEWVSATTSVRVMVVDHTRVNFATNTYVPGNPVSLRPWSETPGIYPAYNTNYDSDSDGLPDAWEITHFGNLSQNWAGDWDHDGVSNAKELAVNFKPANADTDGDHIPDNWELSHLEKFAIYSPSLSASLFKNETSTSPIYLSNDTGAVVSYSAAVANNNTAPRYSYKDSFSGEVPFDWTSIASNETLLPTLSNSDDAVQQITLGFNFLFAGHNYSTAGISANGMITFVSGGIQYPDYGLTFPDPWAPEKMIAPFWDDLNPAAGGEIFFKKFSDRVVVQYQNVPSYSSEGSYTFQVILFSNGNIKFLYKSGPNDGATDFCAIGIQDATTDFGISIPPEHVFNGADFAVLITYTDPVYSYSIKDSPGGGEWSDWTSIASTENLLSSISDEDDGEETVTLGFNFPFSRSDYSSIHVSSNGLITFASEGNRYPAPGQTFPDPSAPEKLIAPFWDDLNPGAEGDIYCKTYADHVVVQYENVVPYAGEGSYTFQVILFSNGNIKFLYKAGLDDGEVNSCAIGIQDASTDLGISIPREPIFNGDNIALLISPKSEFFSAAPLSGTIQPHSVATVSGTFRSFTLPPAIYEAGVSIAAGGGQATQGLTARLQVKNTPSTVEITAYPEGESLPQNEMVYLSATVGDVEGVTRVEFYDGQTLIGESIGDGSSHSTGGFSPIPGNHSFFARVVDIYGGITDSTPLVITVVADPVSILLSSPATGQSILQGEAVDISASASHFDGITKVEFFSNATKIGESVAPTGGDFRYTLDSGLPHGSHQIVARATTTGGITADSASVTLMVIADTDLDGIPDQWELDHGFNPNDPSDALGDKDGDGLTNREEYRTGSDPALPRIHSFTKTHNQNGTITYTWVSNADLGDWFRIEDELPDGTRKPLYSTTYGSDKLSFVSGSTSYSLTLDPATDFIP